MFKDIKAYSGFSVDDIPKAKEFYAETLGLDAVQDDSMAIPMLRITLATGGGIMVYPKDNHEPASYTILNFPVDDIDEAVEKLTEKGVHFESYDMGPVKTDEKGIARGQKGYGPSIAWFKDPAGNVLSVLQEM